MAKIQLNNNGTLVQGKKVQLNVGGVIKNAKKIQKNINGVITTLWQGKTDRFMYESSSVVTYITDENFNITGSMPNDTYKWGHYMPFVFNVNTEDLMLGGAGNKVATVTYNGVAFNSVQMPNGGDKSFVTKSGLVCTFSGGSMNLINPVTNVHQVTVQCPRPKANTGTRTYSPSFYRAVYNPINDFIYVVIYEDEFRISDGSWTTTRFHIAKLDATTLQQIGTSIEAFNNTDLECRMLAVDYSGNLLVTIGTNTNPYMRRYDINLTLLNSAYVGNVKGSVIPYIDGSFAVINQLTSSTFEINKYSSTMTLLYTAGTYGHGNAGDWYFVPAYNDSIVLAYYLGSTFEIRRLSMSNFAILAIINTNQSYLYKFTSNFTNF